MAKENKKTKGVAELERQIGELTQDLQRTRADFENYRKRVEAEKVAAVENGRGQAIMKLLPLIDTIERAILHTPEELKNNSWANGVVSLGKNLQKMLKDLNVQKIEITPGETEFNPDLHEAVAAEDGDSDKEIVIEELQAGYLFDEQVIRHAMVKVAR